MPELPEVEVTRRALAPYLEGLSLRAVHVRQRRLRWPVPAGLTGLLAGQPLLQLQRRGKYLLWQFAPGTLISHLGMSGSWRLHLHQPPPPGKHDHVDLEFAAHDGVRVARLTDPRRFGALLWHPRQRGAVERHALLAALGVEPFDPRFDAAYLQARLRDRRAPIKHVLLAGDVVVGVGNIYASECLFRAGIDPRTPAHRLGPQRCARLVAALRAVLAEAIEAGGSTLRDFIGADGGAGYFMLKAQVYGRAGWPCCVCGARIRRIVQGQRATYFCPRCQR
ncbi:MAG: bifunctional DNA-formamidopyrimidine glycosylase/DNA-(apurinic or apyrimidinic site) lyase [Sutterellaceae bacterium]|nr:bifunctional DNA-formamidopyrimidine glycosylase/DNA-(apurinic or apyrimidinic site) lyase [Burkholderiaceae bacterium]MCX7901379.1 bifunctional DNA-formamidopyrimidine glycosylase/DNA-(apurinic or apyrimidinic site) lyase [Burkholderiaceae bacterium]MDW8430264.1 bifunctional DNA-formamidopyrimidine glycosylase/DNA-(apurinic or apyrimidinic site) lyase [Sutterellaceae bacterium]